MPFMSDTQLAHLRNHMARLEHRAHTSLAKMREHRVMHRVKVTAETVGGAAFLAWAGGQWQARGHNCTVFGFDASLVIGMGLATGAYLGVMGRYNEDALNAANGILAAYASRWAYETGHSAGAAGRLT